MHFGTVRNNRAPPPTVWTAWHHKILDGNLNMGHCPTYAEFPICSLFSVYELLVGSSWLLKRRKEGANANHGLYQTVVFFMWTPGPIQGRPRRMKG